MKTAKPENIKQLLREQTKQITRHVSVLKEDFSGQLKVVAEAVAGVSESLTIVKEDLEFIKGNLVRKVNYDDFFALTKRVSKLEEKVK